LPVHDKTGRMGHGFAAILLDFIAKYPMPISTVAFIRGTVLAMLLGLATLVAIVGFNLWLVRETAVYSATVTMARQQRSAIVDLRTSLDQAETGQRGYLLTGDASYLDPYRRAERDIPKQLDQVRVMTVADPVERDAVAKLIPIVTSKLAELRQTVNLFDGGRHDDALAVVKSNRGRDLSLQAAAVLTALVQHAEGNIDAAVRKQNDNINTLQWATVGGVLFIVLVVGGSVWMVVLYTRQLVSARYEVQGLNLGLEERVRERTADLGRANEEIQRFAYIVTHDLRAPLVNVMGFTSELEGCLGSIKTYMERIGEEPGDAVAEEARRAALTDLPEAIGFIRSSTRKMDGLINAILKLSREGRRVLKPEPIRLENLLKTAADNVQHQMTEAGGDILIDAKTPPVISDRLALEQIFGNLLDNAVKYRVPDRPLKIRIRADEGRDRRVVVSVEDNGRGIARQDHERVFDLFRRSGTQDRPGEGIGLAHVRTMARSLGGEITLQSELDRGTTMTLNLPRDLRTVRPLTGEARREPAS
jgi:signal transduction histidine kinase